MLREEVKLKREDLVPACLCGSGGVWGPQCRGRGGDRTKSDDGEGARLEGSFRSERQERGSHVRKSQQAPTQLTSEE